jgi:TolB-like protein/DNA-binding winged helix-turn-helix (wHTH) protein/Tfp pilus assembly protein PilF
LAIKALPSMQTSGSGKVSARFGPFEAHLRSGELRKHGIRIRLQDQPFQILAALLERPGDLVTREELRARLWPSDTFVDFDHGLNTAINKLREALGDSAETPRYIETLARRGYRFIAPVEETPSAVATADPAQPEIILPDPAPPGVVVDVREVKPSRPFQKRRWVVTISFLTTAVLAVVVIGFQYQRMSGPETSVTALSGAPTRIESLAVLPLENLTGDPGQEYFVDGMTEALITNLARIRSLRVISRTSVMQYKNAREPLPEIVRKLRVDGIVEGSVQRAGDTVRVSVSLVHGPSDRHLWAREYKGDVGDILGLQAQIASTIAGEVQANLTPQEQTQLAGGARLDPAVYELYLKGRFRLNERSREGLLKSIEFFQQAIARKPDYAEAHAGLADSYNMLALHDFMPPREAYPKAKAEATRALEINDGLADAYAARALTRMWSEWDWVGARKDFERAIELNPGSAAARHRYGLYLAALGRPTEAIPELERSRELDPLSPVINAALGDGYLLARRYERAIDQYRKTLEIDPDYRGAKANLGWALVHRKRYNEAEPIFRQLDEPAALVYVYALAGKRQDASQALEKVLRAFRAGAISPYDVATAYVGLSIEGTHGEAAPKRHATVDNVGARAKDQAFHFLEQAYAQRSTYMVLLKVDPALDPLQDDPRFQKLVHRVGFPR